MYTFGNNRKQKHPNTYVPGEYLLLASDPAYGQGVSISKRMPSFTFANRYITKRHLMRRPRTEI